MEKEWPITLKVDIEPEGLKRVVEEGRLLEFVDALSTLASEHIQVKLVDEMARASVGLTEVNKGVHMIVGFLPEEPYGVGPWPWPKGMLRSATLRQELREIVREEIAHM